MTIKKSIGTISKQEKLYTPTFQISLEKPVYQGPYWVATSGTIPANSQIGILIEDGFALGFPWIPANTQFIMDLARITINRNLLIEFAVGVQDQSLAVTAISYAYGYQDVKISPKRSYIFKENTRPIYIVYNPNDVDVDFDLTILGTTEIIR